MVKEVSSAEVKAESTLGTAARYESAFIIA
jgi:hypothetical protein